MAPTRRATLALAWALLALSGCDSAFSGPDFVESAEVRVRVTGGLAGVDYTYLVSSDGAVLGVACASGCAFTPGDTLLHLTEAQSTAFVEAVNRSGLPTAGRPVDFGEECCDHFMFRVTFASGAEVRTFSGATVNMPEPLQVLVETLQRYYEGAPPVILRQVTGLVGLDTDALAIESVSVDGDLLVVAVRYGGGCARHDIDAVAWTGWMESHPVQLGVALTHDDGGDACKALVSRVLRFDLGPVRRAYAAAYGRGPATIVLRVEPAGAGSSVQAPYSFP